MKRLFIFLISLTLTPLSAQSAMPDCEELQPELDKKPVCRNTFYQRLPGLNPVAA